MRKEEKMKRKAIIVLAAALLAAVLPFSGCKKADVATATLKVIVSDGVSGTPASGSYTMNVGEQMTYNFTLDAGYHKLTVQLDGNDVAASGIVTFSGDHTLKAFSDENGTFTLTVSLGTGVTGTPASGIHSYAAGTVVHYSYSLAAGYTNLSPLLDAVGVTSSGNVTMSANHSINVTASAIYNIQGAWNLTETYTDGSSFNVAATFSGDFAKGTVTDSQGGRGTYTYDNATVKFTLVFPDVTYQYTGTFSDSNDMSGTCTRYQTADNVVNGTWKAVRSTSTVASRGVSASSDKGKFDRR
jgi:hypothetical protein